MGVNSDQNIKREKDIAVIVGWFKVSFFVSLKTYTEKNIIIVKQHDLSNK